MLILRFNLTERIRDSVRLNVFEKGGEEKFQIKLDKFILAKQQKLLYEFYNKIPIESIKLSK